jgi:SAM-dependent methyltransferase
VDRNFFQLWVARRWIAPNADYVCADASVPLPFRDSAFRAAVCTDAFHLFPNQRRCLAELRRCGDLVIIDRVGNGLLEPHDVESELDPAGYIGLLDGAPYRMVGQRELVAGYLAGHGPALATERPIAEFADEKWLSIVIDETRAVFTDHPRFATPPHAQGRLGVNPIYRVERGAAGVRLLFEFPSTWYAFENADMLSYHTAGIRLTEQEFAAAQHGIRDARTEELVNRFVLIGMPEHYVRSPMCSAPRMVARIEAGSAPQSQAPSR